MKRLIIAGALLVAAFVTPALAAQQDFEVVNSTGQAILTLQVSPSDEDSWGEDILGVDVLGADEQAEISFSADEDSCLFDIRVTYEDGDTGAWQGLNLCELSVVELT